MRLTAGRWPLVASLGLLVFLAGLVAAAAFADYRSRDGAPETVVRRYFAALEAGDASTALDQIAPATRAQWAEFVENGVLNTYRVKGIAVRVPSVIETSSPRDPTEATIFLDITQWIDDARWEASPRVPLLRAGGRWFLARPPLAPAA